MSTQGQNKQHSISVNFGFHQSDSYQKLFNSWDEPTSKYPTKQVAALFTDFNLLYTRQTKNPKLAIVLGIGTNNKGLKEEGMSYDGASTFNAYKSNIKIGYIGLLAGVSYELVQLKKININISQLLNPETSYNAGSFFKPILLATRTNLTVAWKILDNFSVNLTPYFFTSLSKYNKYKTTNSSSNYMPYSYGVNLGVEFGF